MARSFVTRLTMVSVLALASLTWVGACDDDDDNGGFDGGAGTGGGGTGGGGTGGGGTGGGAGDAGVAMLTDSQIIGVVIEANNGEIAAGNLAVQKATTASARTYGMEMVTMHTAANTQTMQLAQTLGLTAGDSPLRQQLASLNAQTAQTLMSLSGAAFDAAYLASQVTAHQVVLNGLDQVLIPQADAAQLRTFLMTLRSTVNAHLNQARALVNPDGGAPDAGY